VMIPPVNEIEIVQRRRPVVPPEEYLPFQPDADKVPPMASAGEGYRVHVTGLTHDERGYPAMTAAAQDRLVRRLVDKVEQNSHDIIDVEEDGLEEAEIVVCSYGISARVSRIAVEQAREEGIRVGMLRLITVWPFPEARIREISTQTRAFIVPEINYGQISLEVERCACGNAMTVPVSHMGGGVHSPDEILRAIKSVVK